MKKISVAGPSITKLEIEYVTKAIKYAWYEGAYRFVQEFEKKTAAYIGMKYALATSSCTGALHLALLSLNIGKGDEVIVPDTTWIATVAPVVYVGAKPVFVDIEKDTWCIDPSKIEKAITKKTKAIIPVHLYGHPAEMDQIRLLARRHKLYIIEDAAQSIGAQYKNKRTGSLGDISCFSFHGTKTLTTSEGGMLLTSNKKIYDRAVFLNSHGKSDIPFWNNEIGYKYKMTDLQAALGIAQITRIESLVRKKVKIFHWYKEYLGDYEGVTLNVEKFYCKNTYWMVNIIIDRKFGLNKTEIMKKLQQCGIDARPFFYPLTSMPPFKRYHTYNPVAYSLSNYGLNLPCNLRMTKSEVKFVSNHLIKILKLK